MTIIIVKWYQWQPQPQHINSYFSKSYDLSWAVLTLISLIAISSHWNNISLTSASAWHGANLTVSSWRCGQCAPQSSQWLRTVGSRARNYIKFIFSVRPLFDGFEMSLLLLLEALWLPLRLCGLVALDLPDSDVLIMCNGIFWSVLVEVESELDPLNPLTGSRVCEEYSCCCVCS